MPAVLITGSTSGIGLGIAKVFKHAGWTVIGVSRGQLGAEATSYHDFYVQADLTKADDVNEVFKKVSAKYNKLDALVNNAGVNWPVHFIEDFPLEDWDGVIAINLRAPWLMVKTFLPLLKVAKGAVNTNTNQVNIGSVHANATTACMSAYATTKGGIAAMTRAMAIELGKRHQIRVNCINPGAVDTPLHRKHLDAELAALKSDDKGGDSSATVEGLMNSWSSTHSVVGRVGQPEEIGHAALFLCDNAKAAFVTGECMLVDGGLCAQLVTGQ